MVASPLDRLYRGFQWGRRSRQSPGLRRRLKRTFGRSSGLTVSIATADEKKGGLDLRLVRFQIAGGDSSPAIVPNDPQASYLLDRIRAGEMPPSGEKLVPREIEIIERWLAGGAKTERPEPESISPGLGITAEERSWWPFRPIVRPAVSLKRPIRACARRSMRCCASMPSGLSFSPDADKRSLILRSYFDLLGLPPSPEEVEQFVTDRSADAYVKLVDRLLASPHYGEHGPAIGSTRPATRIARAARCRTRSVLGHSSTATT